MTVSFMLYQGAMICIIGRIAGFKIFVIEHAKEYKAEIVCCIDLKSEIVIFVSSLISTILACLNIIYG